MGTAVWLSVLIFISSYVVIISDKIHRTKVALVGAALMVVLGVIEQAEAITKIDFNTIGLLVGMMIIVAITKRTGIFQYLAIKAARFAKGNPWRIMLYLSIFTAVCSAFLDNVTTVLLVAPITLSISRELKMNPIPFLITQVMASNIGGTATLIGDPPNIMIGGATKLGFMDFVVNLAPVVIVIFIVTMIVLKYIFRHELKKGHGFFEVSESFDVSEVIADYPLLIKSLVVLGLTILGFVLHQTVGLESASIALAGAALLLIISPLEPEEILHEIEWPTLFFFIGLFILVGGIEKVGIIEIIAKKSLVLTGGDLVLTGLMVLWLSAIASAFIDNIPFVAAMIPLLQTFGQVGNLDIAPLWWALSLGACLGGNGTIIGASANVIVAGIAEENGYPIKFLDFMKIAFPVMLISIVISMIYLLLFYLR